MRKIFHFTSMRELSMGAFATNFFSLVDVLENVEHSIESDDFKKAKERLYDHIPAVRELERKQLGSELTAEIDRLHADRINELQSVLKILSGYNISNDPSEYKPAKVLLSWYQPYSSVLPYGRKDDATHGFDKLGERMEMDSEFLDAAEQLNLTAKLAKMVNFSNQMKQAHSDRFVVWGGENAPDIDTNAIKRDAMVELKFLIENIQFHATHNPSSCYRLVRSISKLSMRIRSIVERAKTLRRQARAMQNAGAPAVINAPAPVAKKVTSVTYSNGTFGMPTDFGLKALPAPGESQIPTPEIEENSEEQTHDSELPQNGEMKEIS